MSEIKQLNSARPWGEFLARRRTSRTFRAIPGSGDSRHDEFDSGAWTALVEEQKLAIAKAAGVDPSKVRIRVGH